MKDQFNKHNVKFQFIVQPVDVFAGTFGYWVLRFYNPLKEPAQ